MTAPNIYSILAIVAAFLILGSSIILLIEKKWKGGSIEMVVGAILMVIALVASLWIYYYSVNHQYLFEDNQGFAYGLSSYLIHLMPIGLSVFAIGFARYTKLAENIRSKLR